MVSYIYNNIIYHSYQIFSSLLLGLTIGLTHPNHWVLDYGNLTLLGIVNFSFFVIEIVDAVSQFGNDPIPDTPVIKFSVTLNYFINYKYMQEEQSEFFIFQMFVFGSCGVILFLIACGGSTATFAKSPKNSSSLLLAIGIISFFNALLHLLDVVLIFLFGY